MYRKYLTQFCVITCFVAVLLIHQSESRSFQFVHHKQVQRKCPQNSYYDTRHERCRALPKGGEVVIIDYTKECTRNARGAKPHPTKKDYFYVCKNDSVVLGKCPNSQLYNARTKQCEGRNPIPCDDGKDGTTCSTTGRFPVPSNCSQFYICDRDGRQYYRKVLECPGSKNYNPLTQRCSYSYRCTPTMVYSTDSTTVDDINDFPRCKAPGRFRSPTNCALYFVCGLKKDGRFYQRRYRCPEGRLFDTIEKVCLDKSTVKCEYTTASRIMQLDRTEWTRYNEESSEYPEPEPEDSLLDYYDSTNYTKLLQDTHIQNAESIADRGVESNTPEVGDIVQTREHENVMDSGDESSTSIGLPQTVFKHDDSGSEGKQDIPPQAAPTEEIQTTKGDTPDIDTRKLVDILTKVEKEVEEKVPESEKSAIVDLEILIEEEEKKEVEEERGEPKEDQSAPGTPIQETISNNTPVQDAISENGDGSTLPHFDVISQNVDQSTNRNIGGGSLNQDTSLPKSGASQTATNGSDNTTVPETSPAHQSSDIKQVADSDLVGVKPEANQGKTITSSGQSGLSSESQISSSLSQGENLKQEVLSATVNANAPIVQNEFVETDSESLTSKDHVSATTMINDPIHQKESQHDEGPSATFEDSTLSALQADTTVFQTGLTTGGSVPLSSEDVGSISTATTIAQKGESSGEVGAPISETGAATATKTDTAALYEVVLEYEDSTGPSQDKASSSMATSPSSQMEYTGQDGAYLPAGAASAASGLNIKHDVAENLNTADQKIVVTVSSTNENSAVAVGEPSITGYQLTSKDQPTSFSIQQSSQTVQPVIGSDRSVTYSTQLKHFSSENESQDFLPDNEDENVAQKPSHSKLDQTVGTASGTEDTSDVRDFISDENEYSETKPSNYQSQASSSNIETSLQDPNQNVLFGGKLQIFYRVANESSLNTDGSTLKDEVLLNVFKPLRLVINFDPQGRPVQQVVGFQGGYP